jgi:hypothetical protein
VPEYNTRIVAGFDDGNKWPPARGWLSFVLTSAENCTTIEEVGEAEATAGEHRRGIPDWTHRGR